MPNGDGILFRKVAEYKARRILGLSARIKFLARRGEDSNEEAQGYNATTLQKSRWNPKGETGRQCLEYFFWRRKVKRISE